MQAARASTRAFKAIAITGSKQTRNLSMTGAVTNSKLLTSDKPVYNGMANFIRLPSHETIPVPEASETGSKVRHFNTSRSLKAVGDSSTIDFAYIPDFDPDTQTAPVKLRVPILPWTNPSAAIKAELTEAEAEVMTPTIHTVAADGTHVHAPSAMSEMTDSNQFDYQGLAASVAEKLSQPAGQSTSMVRQILGDMLEDIMGPKKSAQK
ncbi:hypothetical protein ACN47E_004691 [Coniothyrium glycines]